MGTVKLGLDGLFKMIFITMLVRRIPNANTTYIILSLVLCISYFFRDTRPKCFINPRHNSYLVWLLNYSKYYTLCPHGRDGMLITNFAFSKGNILNCVYCSNVFVSLSHIAYIQFILIVSIQCNHRSSNISIERNRSKVRL